MVHLIRTSICTAAAILAFASVPRTVAAAAGPAMSEREVKAAAVYQLINFVAWPPAAFDRDGAPLVVGIYGPDPFSGLLEELVDGETAQGHPIHVLHCENTRQALGCHVLVFGHQSTGSIARVLDQVRGRPVLTIGDNASFNEDGGIVRLGIAERRIRLFVNLGAAQRANLTLSAKLLQLSEITEPPDRD